MDNACALTCQLDCATIIDDQYLNGMESEFLDEARAVALSLTVMEVATVTSEADELMPFKKRVTKTKEIASK